MPPKKRKAKNSKKDEEASINNGNTKLKKASRQSARLNANKEKTVIIDPEEVLLESIETEVVTDDVIHELNLIENKISDDDKTNYFVAKKSLPIPINKSETIKNVKTRKRRINNKLNINEQNNENSNKTFPCIDCGQEFNDMNTLVDHELNEHGNKFRCPVCSKAFTRKYHLDRHLQLTPCSGQPPPAHPCDVCGKVYTRKDNLREHLRVHAGEVTRMKKFKCEFCPKMFHGASLLRIHERTHTGEKPFQCDHCSKAFPSGGALTKHRRIHTGEKPYNCPECNIRFSLKGTLNRHMRIHTGIRPHKCPYCEKSFIQAGGLKAHLFYHTGQNGFKCEHCDKTFNRKARLQMHNRYVHEKDRPFECSECSKKFTRKEDLNRHFVLHTGEKPHQCPTCNKSFAIKPSLKLHLLTHTKEEPRSCQECGRAFIRKDCLLRHMRKRHRDMIDKALLDEKGENTASTDDEDEEDEEDEDDDQENKDDDDESSEGPTVLSEEELCESIKELLSLLVDESTLKGFGWPETPVDQILESVIKRCGHTPVREEDYSFYDRLRENSKLLFTVVIDDNAVKTLLNNQTVDEVILHVLKLAKS